MQNYQKLLQNYCYRIDHNIAKNKLNYKTCCNVNHKWNPWSYPCVFCFTKFGIFCMMYCKIQFFMDSVRFFNRKTILWICGSVSKKHRTNLSEFIFIKSKKNISVI